jgi:hypothetical protein
MEWLKLIIDAQERGDLQGQINILTQRLAEDARVDSIIYGVLGVLFLVVFGFLAWAWQTIKIDRLQKALKELAESKEPKTLDAAALRQEEKLK